MLLSYYSIESRQLTRTSLSLDPWSGPQHIAIFEELSQLIQEVDPSVVMLDSLFGPSLDATREQNRRHAILSANALINNFAEIQPYASILWKYPALGSSYGKLNIPLFIHHSVAANLL